MKKLVLVLAVGLLVGADGADKKEAKADKDKMQGTWEVVSAERMGKAMPDPKEHKLVIEGDTLAVQRGDKVMFKGKFKLDPAQKPRTLDLEITEGGGEKYKGKVSRGIYVVDGDTLKWCNAEPGVEDRPNQFATNGEKNHMLIVLKREKK